jgi:hypothetical protein
VKKPLSKGYILFDAIYPTFLESKNYEMVKTLLVAPGKERGSEQLTKM